MSFPDLGLLNVLPMLILTGWACVLLLVDLFIPSERKYLTPILAALGLAVALIFTLPQVGSQTIAFDGMLVMDGFAVALSLVVLVSGLPAIALAYGYLKRMDIERGEYYPLMLFSVVGVMLMAAAADLIVVFLALELFSIPLYIMAAFDRHKEASEEAGIKYFLLGAFSGGFVLYGIALIYGAAGSTHLQQIFAAANGGLEHPVFFIIGSALILVGLGFKVAAVPFHMWTPDVYQGSPTSTTAFMAVIAKVGGFAALLRIFITALPSTSIDLSPVLWGLAAATLIVGNVLAIAQTNIKRLLAYSSISHAGFMLMAVTAYGDDAVHFDAAASIIFYLLAFAITSFGAWAVVISLEGKEDRGLALADYAGLARKNPIMAAAMAAFMFSFTGIPPTIGFAGKLYIFRAVIEAGFVGLAVIGVLTSLVSAYYYLRVIVIMYMQDGKPAVHKEPLLQFVTAAAGISVLGLIFLAEPLFSWAANSVLRLF